MRSYRRFLIGMSEDMLELVGSMENEGVHHALDSAQGAWYVEVVRWLVEMDERVKHYDDTKGRPSPKLSEGAAAPDGMDRSNR